MKKTNKIVVIVIILAILLIAVVLHNINKFGANVVKDFVSPIFSVQKNIKRGIIDQSLLLNNKRDLLLSLEAAQKEKLILQEKINLLEAYKKKSNQLRSNLQLPPLIDYEYIFADVILRDPIFWNEKFIINKGSNSGFEIGNIVLTPIKIDKKVQLVVVGRIDGKKDSLSEKTAVVATIYNKSCNMSVKMKESNSYGILKGGDLQIHFLPKKKKYQKKNSIVTSGYSDIIPPNLLIGESIPIQKNDEEKHSFKNLYKKVKVTPNVDIDNLDIVVVIKAI